MGKGAVWVLFLFLSAILFAISLRHPSVLSDQGNEFLKDFMDNDVLSVLGFITAVGSAGTLGIFLHLNDLEDNTEAKFERTKLSLKRSAVSLVVVFLVAFISLIVKPLLPSKEVFQALSNSVGILCVVFSLSVLRDLTLTVFAIPTRKAVAEIAKRNRQETE